ncbi:MAG: response regulator [Sphingobacteriales bacterium]|nr:MAG: response regulator [Sphingobacteriales bacterium]
MTDYNGVEILFAEDSMDDAALTIRALNKCGFTNKVFHVKDGAEALDFIYCRGKYEQRNKTEQPTVIFLDLKMPKVSGLEVLAQIKSDPHWKTIPTVILTSSNEDPDIKECYALGANSYIVKPVESENFTKAITELGLYWMMRSKPAK